MGVVVNEYVISHKLSLVCIEIRCLDTRATFSNMNIHGAYINEAMPTCDGDRVFVPPGYNYQTTERLILGAQPKAVRDCYYVQLQDQAYDVKDIGGWLQQDYNEYPVMAYDNNDVYLQRYGAPVITSFTRPVYR